MRTTVYGVGRFIIPASLLLAVLVGPEARAQFSGNNQTNVISGISSNWTGPFIVGSNTFLDSLQILNGAVLATGDGFVGYLVGGSNNSVLVSGTGSIWTNHANLAGLDIGHNGSGNSLTITNGGLLYCNGSCNLGNSSSSSNNVLIVTGTNSALRDAEVNVGSTGSSNQLIIASGGAVFNNNDTRIGFSIFANNNQTMVTGPGSVLSNSGGMYVAFSGAGNSLTITNGGQAICNYLTYIGYDVHASNNVVTVTGTGSVWNITAGIGTLYVGNQGPQNRLVINNGGAVYDDSSFIGDVSSGSNNIAMVTGPGSVWSNRANLSVGEGGGMGGNQLIISGGGVVYDNTGTINDNSFGSNDFVIVSDTGSVWSNSSNLYVGGGGPGNTLTVTNRGAVFNASGFVGFSNSSSNNTVFVDFFSVWNNSGNLYVGYDGSSNRLMIAPGLAAPGGTVIASNAYVGFNADSANNQIVVNGYLFVTNANRNAVLDIRCGQVLVNPGGELRADILIITNVCGHLVNNGGFVTYSQLILDPNLDADGDGLPNGWEQSHGLDPLSTNGVNGANGDPDGDGFSNLQEYLAGTDPTNPASAFRITSVVSTGNNVLISWMTGVGKTNALQRTAGAGDGSYNTNGFVDLFIVTNTMGTVTNYLDVGAATNFPVRYYRVRLVP
jgi:T5SS/PEP-CTERM-associated repeat protein